MVHQNEQLKKEMMRLTECNDTLETELKKLQEIKS